MINTTLDFETYYGTGYSLSLQKYNTPTYVRDPQFKIHMLGVRIEDEPAFILSPEEIRDWIAQHDWANTRMIAHNAAFDGFILSDVFNVHPARYFCTQAANRAILQGEVRNGLEFVAPRWGVGFKGKELVNSKNKRDLTEEEFNELAGYCATNPDSDINLTWRLFQKMRKHLPEKEQELMHMTTEQFCKPELLLDDPRLTAYLNEQKSHREALVKAGGASEKSFASPAKFAALLEKHGVTPPQKYSNKQKKLVPAVAQDDLEWLQLQDQWKREGNTQLLALAAARMECASSINLTRPQRLLDYSNGGNPIGAPYNYYKAHTGRWTGAESMNYQNFRRGSEVRKSIKAPPGFVLNVRDLSQIELRMNAYLSGEQWVLDTLADGVCIYSKFGGQIYNDPEEVWRQYKALTEQFPEYGEKRFVGKVSELGLGYGMGWEKYQFTLAVGAMGPPVIIDEAAARNIVYDLYRPSHPKIVEQWGLFQHYAMQMLDPQCNIDYKGIIRFGHQHISLPNGMYLYYPKLRWDSEENNLVYWDAEKGYWKKLYGGLIAENVIQALSRIVMTDAMLKINPHYRIVLHTHDELVSLCRVEEAEQCGALMEAALTTPPTWCAGIPLECEGGYDVCYSK